MIAAGSVALAVAVLLKLVGPGDAGSDVPGLVGLGLFVAAVVLGLAVAVRRLAR